MILNEESGLLIHIKFAISLSPPNNIWMNLFL
jgi:hypothetical protein